MKKKPEIINSRNLSLKGIFIDYMGEGQGRMKPGHCSFTDLYFLAMQCLRKNYLS